MRKGRWHSSHSCDQTLVHWLRSVSSPEKLCYELNFVKIGISHFQKEGNLGRRWARVQLWIVWGRTRICFQLRSPQNDLITERVPTFAPGFHSFWKWATPFNSIAQSRSMGREHPPPPPKSWSKISIGQHVSILFDSVSLIYTPVSLILFSQCYFYNVFQ